MKNTYYILDDLFMECDITEDEVLRNNKLEIPFKNVSIECCKEIVDRFPNLRHLDINTGQMDDEYAMELSKLKYLESLDISANRITNLGVKYLSTLENMKTLDLSLCDIDDDCLEDVVKMKNLHTLHLSGTRISIFGLIRLKELPNLMDCDLKRSDCAHSLTNELLRSRKIQDVFKYIDSKINQSIPVGNFRLVLLGEPASGKTALFNNLCGFEYYRRTSTLGINIRQFNPKNEYKDLVNYPFNVWDFGGQLTQNLVHNAFVSENCIFAITIEPRMNDCERSFIRWYRNIHTFVKSLPIIVIFTKCDNENGGIGNSIDYEETIEDLKLKIKQELDYELADLSIRTKPDLIFVKSSSMVDGGLIELLTAVNSIIFAANQNESFQISDSQKKLLKCITEMDKEIFCGIDNIKKFTKDIYGMELNSRRIADELKVISKFGDVFFDGDISTKGVLKNPSLLSDIIYEIIVGAANGEDFNISFEKYLEENGEYKQPYSMCADDITNYFKLDTVKNTNNRISKTLLKYLSSRKFIFKSSFDSEQYYIPSKFPYRWRKTIAEEFNFDNSVRHFKYRFRPSVNGISWQILSSLVSYSKKLYDQDNSEILIEDSDRIYSNGFIVDFEKEKAIIKENHRDNSIDIWITRELPDISERKLLDIIFKCFDNTLNILGYNTQSYTVLCVCPCCGRWVNECNRTHRYLSILNNQESIRCSDSNILVTRDSFLKNSEDHLEYISPDVKEKAFVITPFSLDGKQIYDVIYKKIIEAYEYTISDIIEKPYVCINPNKSTTIDEDIRKGIEESKVIITILDNSKPNVYFEYGYARSFRNKIFITFFNQDNIGELPFDVHNYTTIPMRYDDLDKFKEDLMCKFLEIKKDM